MLENKQPKEITKSFVMWLCKNDEVKARTYVNDLLKVFKQGDIKTPFIQYRINNLEKLLKKIKN